MAMITSALLTALHTAYRADFQRGYDAMLGDAQWRQIAMDVPSSARSNTYGWLGAFPGFREWVGDRVVKSVKASAYQIANKSFEMTVGVDRDDIEDDTVAVYKPMMQRMGEEAARHPDSLLFPLIAAGETTTCYDGQYFFDADHPVYANADGTGAATSWSNVTAGGATPWYVLAAEGAIKPFIVQMRKPPQFVTKFDPSSDRVFMNKEFLWGADDRLNVGYGLPHLARKAKVELTPDAVFAEVQAMMSLKGDGGLPLNIRPDTLLVPPSLMKAAKAAVEDERAANGATNTARGLLKRVIVTNYLA
jgi:phage major head subunit gpT-like protein